MHGYVRVSSHMNLIQKTGPVVSDPGATTALCIVCTVVSCCNHIVGHRFTKVIHNESLILDVVISVLKLKDK